MKIHNCPTNVVLVVTSIASVLFFAVQADASWLPSFLPSRLEIQTTSTFDNLMQPPSQAPSPSPLSSSYESQPTSSPSPSSAPAPAPASAFSSSPSNAPTLAPETSSSQPQASEQKETASSTSTSTTPVSPDNPALGEICDKTDYPALCRSSVFPFLHSNAINQISVIKSSIDACVKHTQEAIQKATELAAGNVDNTEVIEVCQESYATTVDALQESALALASNDLGTFRTKMSSVITNIGTCDETFGEDPEMESSSPLTAVDQTITRLASNILAIAERI